MNIKHFSVHFKGGPSFVNLPFIKNTLMLVGSNGEGKSRVLKSFYLFLTGQWEILQTLSVESAEMQFEDDSTLQFNSNHLNVNQDALQSAFLKEQPRSNDSWQEIVHNYEKQKAGSLLTLKQYLIKYEAILTESYDFPPNLINKILTHAEGTQRLELDKQLTQKLSLSKENSLLILYYPTYRQSERSFSEVFPSLKGSLATAIFNKYSKFISPEENLSEDFEDTEDANEDFEENSIQSFIGDELEEYYSKNQNRQTSDNIDHLSYEEVINFGGEPLYQQIILSEEQAEERSALLKQLLGTYFPSLLSKISLETTELQEDVLQQFNQLSSGEKQLLAFLIPLIYAKEKRIYMVIDEPEISFNGNWQESFIKSLDELTKDHLVEEVEPTESISILNKKLVGIFLASHSPFLITEDYDSYLWGVNRFKTNSPI
ncbi:AAA family ATPase [Saprospira grandis]|uniref:Endonuclease GajA/Old nuclease/RecF-like AAA domain-containing protein n=1 Tax=Saprospira grandis (strain Lewin) TaxID=984262 RepID=H6L5T0_SAPGL|nr:AAA family ATPase [Saprospira grandis]AFC26330.1 hypothetical protein SGRA_3606 [Saprospira grandis str. Lewin]